MASIHKNPRSRYWRCVFTDADGKRVYRSTKQTNKTAALRVALTYEDTAKSAKHGHVTTIQLRKVIGETVAKVTDEVPILHSIFDWFTSWKEDMISSKATGTGVRYGGLVDDFLASLGKKAPLDLASLSKQDIQAFRDSRTSEGRSDSSADIALKTIRTCLELAVSQGLITHNPAKAVTLLGRDDSIKRAFTRDEVQEMLVTTIAEPEWNGMIKVGYYVGGRLQNCAHTRFEEIDFDRQLLRYIPVKQKKGTTLKELSHRSVTPCAPSLRRPGRTW